MELDAPIFKNFAAPERSFSVKTAIGDIILDIKKELVICRQRNDAIHEAASGTVRNITIKSTRNKYDANTSYATAVRDGITKANKYFDEQISALNECIKTCRDLKDETDELEQIVKTTGGRRFTKKNKHKKKRSY